MFVAMFIGKCSIIKQKIGFKHVRFKSSARTRQQNQVSAKEAYKLRVNKLSEIIGCTALTAREIIARNNSILALESHNFVRNAKFCSKHLKISDIVEFPIVITLNSSLLQHRYYSLMELGFSNITASSIIRFLHFIKKTPKVLENEGFSFSSNDHLDHLTNLLPESEKDEVKSRIQQLYSDNSCLWKIKETMNAEFLSVKLNCSLSKAHQMIESYPPLRVQSILNTDRLLSVLFTKCGLTLSKIYKMPNLLSLHHGNVEQFLEEVPDILGVNILNILSKLPLLLRKSVQSVQEVECILKDFNISDKQLLCCPKIITFAPNTLQERLEKLCSSEDFALLKSYKKFLWLVYYYNNLDSRLQALKTADVPCSISMFTVSKSNFSKYLCVSECRTHINDICFFLAELFNHNETEILLKLREYPNYRNSSLLNCQKVVEFLLGSGVSKKQLFNGLGIIFYDIDIVRLYFEDLKSHSECQPFSDWVTHYNLIQLLIYTIEVDTGFRGSRVYKATSRIDEVELMAQSQA